jgi:hypothetical protein
VHTSWAQLAVQDAIGAAFPLVVVTAFEAALVTVFPKKSVATTL